MFYDYLIRPYENYTQFLIFLETTAVLLGIMSVYFSIKKNIFVYPTGIISTGIFIYIMFIFGLLGDMLIQIYYTIMSIYGWVLWTKNSEDKIHIEVSRANQQDWFFSTFLFILSVILVSTIYYFKPLLDHSQNTLGKTLGFQHLDWANWLDVFTSSVFLVGMWLMAKQKLENWYFWWVGNIISVPMFLHKGLGMTAFQYFIFSIMAYLGWKAWRKSIEKKHILV